VPTINIEPRTNECDSQRQHFWTREINGNWYSFVHVKISRTQPRIVVSRETPDGWVDVHTFTV
jgi:hypothetical protein